MCIRDRLKVDGKPVKASESVAIRSGQRIELGHLTFTLLDDAGMLARLDGLPVSKM